MTNGARTEQKRQTWEDAVIWLRQQPEQNGLVLSCYYDDPLIDAAQRYWNSTEWRAVRKFLPLPSGDALDIGAGRGISSYALARDGWRVSALEPDPSELVGAGAIRNLSEKAQLPIAVSTLSGEQLPYEDESFDLVHCRQALHHARALTQYCREAARVLRPGGHFVATREHVISRREDLPTFLDAHPLHRFYGGENAYLLSEYKRAIDDAGISLTHVLNPYQSEINSFPETLDELRNRFADRLHLPARWLLPKLTLTLIGALSNTPGRLYTFIGRKRDG